MRINSRDVLSGSNLVKQRFTLLVSGLIAVGIAATILLSPEVFYAGYGFDIAGNATLVNELKAPAGVLLASGLLMFAGLFRAELVKVSLATAAVVYLSYGLARLSSMALDGLPNENLISAAAIELGVGAACLLALLRTQEGNTQYKFTRRPQ